MSTKRVVPKVVEVEETELPTRVESSPSAEATATVPRKNNNWRKALMAWNLEKKNDMYIIPKKDSIGYKQVKKIQAKLDAEDELAK